MRLKVLLIIPAIYAHEHLDGRGSHKGNQYTGMEKAQNYAFSDYCEAIGIHRNTGRNWLLSAGLLQRHEEKLAFSGNTYYTYYMGMLNIRKIPDDLHKEFKLLCIKRDTNMTDEIIRFMREEVEKERRKK